MIPPLLIQMIILLTGALLAFLSPEYTVPAVLSIAFFLKLAETMKMSFQIPVQFRKIAVTTRVVLLVMFGTLPMMVMGSHLTAVLVFVAYNLGIFLLILMDLRITPKPHQLVVQRDVSAKLSIGENNLVAIRLENHSFRNLELSVIDEFPVGFMADKPDFKFILEKRTQATLRYHVQPNRRGAYQFGNIAVRYLGMLEMVIIQEDFPCAEKIDVFPNIKNISRLDLSIKRSHLIETGLIAERKRGNGTEFESLKEYVRGDEFRKIDWKATARRNKLISREFQVDVNQSVIVAVDCSRAMGARIGDFTLLDSAVNAALLLGHQVTKKGDKIGLIAFSDQVHQFLKPNRGKTHFNSFIHALYNLQPKRMEPDFQAAFTHLIRCRVKRSLLIIITDLASGDAAEKFRKNIWMVSRKHLPVIISIIDPAIKAAAYGRVPNIETAYQKVVALDIIDRVRMVNKAVESLGVVAMSLQPNELNSSLLSAYLKVKMRSRI